MLRDQELSFKYVYIYMQKAEQEETLTELKVRQLINQEQSKVHFKLFQYADTHQYTYILL